MALVEIRNVYKVFQRDSEKIEIFTGLTLDIAEGSFTALMGPSGSGKSTLLNLLAGLDKPTSGSIRVAGLRGERDDPRPAGRLAGGEHRVRLPDPEPAAGAHRLSERGAAAAAHPALQEGARRAGQARARSGGLQDRLKHYPRQLSGGQEQRVAIARAIVADPTLVLLDEPTGQLDAKSSQDVLGLLERLNDEFKKTIIIVTHDAHAAERAKTVLHLEKGALIEREAVVVVKFLPLVLANLGRHKRRVFLTIS